MTRVEPNPHSPYATAQADVRHLFPVPAWLMVSPRPGELTPTSCGELAVVPETPIKILPGEALPEGMCGTCAKARDADIVVAPTLTDSNCSACGLGTCHGELCAMCRQDLHDAWRQSQTAAKPEVADDGQAVPEPPHV